VWTRGNSWIVVTDGRVRRKTRPSLISLISLRIRSRLRIPILNLLRSVATASLTKAEAAGNKYEATEILAWIAYAKARPQPRPHSTLIEMRVA
jgi:hypothetical protein